MAKIEFRIDYPRTQKGRTAFFKRYGLNALYSGKHWAARKKDAEEWHRLVHSELYRQHIRKELIGGPVEVLFFWDDRLDIDNHALMGKMTVDALKGWVLHDDSKRYFCKVTHAYWDQGCIGVRVEER